MLHCRVVCRFANGSLVKRSRRGYTTETNGEVPVQAGSNPSSSSSPAAANPSSSDSGSRPNTEANLSRLLSVLRKAADAQAAEKATAPAATLSADSSSPFQISPEDLTKASQWKKEYGLPGKTKAASTELMDSLSFGSADLASDTDPLNILDASVQRDASRGRPGKRKPLLTLTKPGSAESPIFPGLPVGRKPRARLVKTPAAAESEPWPPKIPEEPYKILVLNVDSSATDSDIRLGFQSLDMDPPLQLKRIELFTEPRGKGGKQVHAFVSLATQEDYDTIMSPTVKPFGVYINGSRSAISPCTDRRTVYIRNLSSIEDESQLRRLLASFTIDLSAIERIELGLSDGEFTGSCIVFFHSHSEAYKAIRYLNNLDGKQRLAPSEGAMSASWGRPGIIQEIRKRKDELDQENKSLKEQISRLSEEVKKMDHAETVADVRLSNVIFKHISKVLETTNFDRLQAAQLLDVSPGKLTRLLSELKKDGLEIKDQRFSPSKVRMSKSYL